MNRKLIPNDSGKQILSNSLLSVFSLFINGFGIYLTIQAGIGASPWDVFNLGLSKTFGILYGSASIAVSLIILAIDITMKEPIGIAMVIDTVVVGKSVDFFRYIHLVPEAASFPRALAMMFVGLFIIGYTQYLYMCAALGCGARDTLLIGLSKHLKKIPIGIISVALLSVITFVGYLLGGPVGIGTLICAFCAGPIMQFIFRCVHFDATAVHHQNMVNTFRLLVHPKQAIKAK